MGHGNKSNQRMNTSNPKTTAQVVAKAAITIACLYFAIRQIDFPAFHDESRHLISPWLSLAMGQFLLIPLLGGQRWRIVLNSLGATIHRRTSIRFFWIGMAFNQVLPSVSGGDAVRVILAWRAVGSLSLAINSVILERVAMLVTLISLIVLIHHTAPGHYASVVQPPIYSLMLLGAVLAVGALLFADKFTGGLPDWRACRTVALLSKDARLAFFAVSNLKLVILCFVTHINTAIGCLWLGKCLGLPLTLPDYVFYLSLVTLIGTLPLSIGGWGIREGAIVVLFGRLGISASAALAFSVAFGLSLAVISLIGVAGIWMDARSRSSGYLRAPTHADAENVDARKSARC